MSIKDSISRTLKRLNLQGIVMKLPVFGKALYDGLSCEFDRVNDFREIVKSSVVPNENMDHSTIEDNEIKYGIIADIALTNDQRIERIIERAQRDGSGGPDWLQDQIQKAGFPLYVHLNTRTVDLSPQYGDFQYGDIIYSGEVTYLDPRTVDGELVASSPNGKVDGQFLSYGDFQYEDEQYGTLVPLTAYPRPKPFTITTDPDRWGYFFFLSPFPDRLAGPSELLELTQENFDYLKKIVIQLKHLRNWAILQVIAVENPKQTVKIFIVDDLGNQIVDDNGNNLFVWGKI